MGVYTSDSPMPFPDAMPTAIAVNSGDTINMPAAPGNTCLCITAAASIAALAVNLPPIPVGCIARIFTTAEVVALTIGGATVFNTVVALAKYDCISLYKLAADTFVRLSA